MSPRRLPALVASLALLLAVCGGDSADPEAFCDNNARLGGLGNVLSAPPDEARPLVTEMREILAEGRATAPPEISSQYAMIVEAFTPILDVFEESGFGAEEVDSVALQAAFDQMNSPETEAANDAVEEWIETNCPGQ